MTENEKRFNKLLEQLRKEMKKTTLDIGIFTTSKIDKQC